MPYRVAQRKWPGTKWLIEIKKRIFLKGVRRLFTTQDDNDMLEVYKCHKEVRAAEIARIDAVDDGYELVFVKKGGGEYTIGVTNEWTNKNLPVAGGYYVEYDDGYTSFSPKMPFEKGYSLVG